MFPRGLNWISDSTDRRVNHIKQLFLQCLDQHSPNVINYYDFLMVAKKLNFRFEESAHLMDLRKYFFDNQNQLTNKKLAGLLCVDQGTLKAMSGEKIPEKIVIRFRVGSEEIESIKQQINEDEQSINLNNLVIQSDEEGVLPYSSSYRVAQPQVGHQQNQQYKQKLAIILSIKVSEMAKKIKLLVEGITIFVEDEQKRINIFTMFQNLTQEELPYQIFKRGVIALIKKLEDQLFKDRLTMSEDDIKAVYLILDHDSTDVIKQVDLQNLKDESFVTNKIAKFYQCRVNKRMVKNTLFKLGKNAHSIQIYQVKNPSIMEFRNIEDGLLEIQKRQKIPKLKTPHFGPIKGMGIKQHTSKQTLSMRAKQDSVRTNHSSLSTYKQSNDDNLGKQRQKIERIIRSSQQGKKKSGKDTIANKLRKLFIHKVILPREKLLEQEKRKYGQSRSQTNSLIVKFM